MIRAIQKKIGVSSWLKVRQIYRSLESSGNKSGGVQAQIARLRPCGQLLAPIFFAIFMLGIVSAQATPVTQFCGDRVCADQLVQLAGHKAKRERRNKRYTAPPARAMDPNGNYTAVIGGRPAGCPHAYCGCGLRKYLGISDVRLNLAANWARLFPRAHAAPGNAVVWRHHVALIVQMVGPREALLRDYNSGGGLSRLHVRSIAGAVIVNPSSRVAMQ